MKRLIAHLLLALALVLAGPVGQVLGDALAPSHAGEEHGHSGHPHDDKCLMSPSCGVFVWSLGEHRALLHDTALSTQYWPREAGARLRSICLAPDTPPPRIV